MPYDIAKLELFSTEPGVYIMRGRQEAVLYVGKAKNLRQRLKQYFFPGRDGRAMVPFLVAKVESIETIIVTSEKEALLLENTLIKEYQPRYNALLKDDKTYIALKVTTKSPWPQALLVRYHKQPKADGQYFGPYTSAHAARATLDVIQRAFPLRQCTDQEFAARTRPCILYDMKRCIAPCVRRCTPEEYKHEVDKTLQFLKGQDKELLRDLYKEMEEYAANLQFESAAQTLKTIRQIEKTVEQQRVDKPLGRDADAWGIYRQGDELVLTCLEIRNGKLMGSKSYDYSQVADDDAELLTSFLLQKYGEMQELPHEILLPLTLEDEADLSEVLSLNKPRKVSVNCPQRGDKRALVEMAETNAKASYQKDKNEKEIRERSLMQLQEQLRLTRYPKRIECFDTSNISGTSLVSTMVAFTEGFKDSNRYRKYKIKSIDIGDDYGAMREVLGRRYKRAKEENDLPDLIIVDGGKGHLNMALKVLHSLDIVSVDVISLAKEKGRHDKGMTQEQVFLPNVKDPIHFPKNSQVLFLLQQIRDEAHRTAIGFHRKLHTKKTIKSAVQDIPGIGEVKRKTLLKHFGSFKKILEATEEELQQVKGITKANIAAIQAVKSKRIVE